MSIFHESKLAGTLKDVFLSVHQFFSTHPLLLTAVYILLFVGFVGAVVSLVTAIINNHKIRLFDEKQNLYHSYLTGTRTKLVRAIRSEYFAHLFSNLWNKFCIYYWVHRFGELTLRSRILGFFAAVPYLMFGVVALIEFFLKMVFGLLLAFVLVPLEIITYFIVKGIFLLAMPIVTMISRSQLKSQRCPDCYTEYKKPILQCPQCHTKHSFINPGEFGMFFARCSCSKLIRILPKYQYEYMFNCPKCGSISVSNRNRQAFVALVSGKGACESKFIHALRICTSGSTDTKRPVLVVGSHNFLAETNPAVLAPTSDPDDVQAISLSQKRAHLYTTDSIVLYPLPAHRVLNDSYAKVPQFLEELNGIVLIIDLTKQPTGASIETQHDREMEGIVGSFIRQLYDITGLKANRLFSTNVAVVVIDSTPLDTSECEQRLDRRGYGTVISQIMSVFKNVRFFASNPNAPGGAFSGKLFAELLPWLCGDKNCICSSIVKQFKRAV